MCKNQETNKASYPLVHLVNLDIKNEIPNNEVEELKLLLQSLEEIPEVHNFEVGDFVDLGDPRANSSYEQILYMEFASKEQYKIYQEHPIHLGVKKGLAQFLAGPPMTYDYTK